MARRDQTVMPSGADGSVPKIDIAAHLSDIGRDARRASRVMAAATTAQKSAALRGIATALERERANLAAANRRDVDAAEHASVERPLIDRLALDRGAIDRMIAGIHDVDRLPDPIGAITDLAYRPTGIQVGRMRVPLGVIAIIYESRPNVTVDAASLCLKAGNACILRGGSEAIHSNRALAKAIRAGIESAGLPAQAVQLIDTTD